MSHVSVFDCRNVNSHTHSFFQFELLVKLTVSIRCIPIVQPQQNPAIEQQPPANSAEVSDDITSSGIKFKLSLLGLTAPIESPVVPSRDFTWDAPVELISSDAWAQQMAVDEESHIAVSMAGAAAPVVLLPLRLASLMGQEKRNETSIVVDSSALGQAPVLMSSISVTITRSTDMLSPALMDRLNPLAITIVCRCHCHPREHALIAVAGQWLLHAQLAILLPAAPRLLHSRICRVSLSLTCHNSMFDIFSQVHVPPRAICRRGRRRQGGPGSCVSKTQDQRPAAGACSSGSTAIWCSFLRCRIQI